MISVDEIQLFFPVNEGEDADEKWEEIFFENKKYFLSFAPIPKIFESRLKKLAKIYTCYLAKIGQENTISDSQGIELQPYPNFVLSAFNLYQSRRIRYKQKVLQATDFNQLKIEIENWLEDEKLYFSNWTGFDDLTVEALMGKEPDPMYIITEVKRWDRSSNKTFNNLRDDKFDLSEILQKEAKRLNLLHNSNS